MRKLAAELTQANRLLRLKQRNKDSNHTTRRKVVDKVKQENRDKLFEAVKVTRDQGLIATNPD